MSQRRRQFIVLRATVGLMIVGLVGVLLGAVDADSAEAAGTGVISGAVTGPGGRPLPEVAVWIEGIHGEEVPESYVMTNEQGLYALTGLPAGGYKLEFVPQGHELSWNYVREWWQNKPDAESATVITLAPGASKSGVNAELTPGASFSGKITDLAGNPIDNAVIWARGEGGAQYSAKSWPDGSYKVGGMPAGDYALKFESPWLGEQAKYIDEWWNDVADYASATRMKVATGQARSGFDARLSTGSTISGRVVGLDGKPLDGALVEAIATEGVERYQHNDYTDPEGVYSIAGLPAGSFEVQFSVAVGARWSYETWRDAPWAPGTTIVVNGSDEIRLGDARIGAIVGQTAGADRYDTAVRVAQSAFQPGVPVVYLASGRDFPDALAAAPMAGMEGGPVLLSPSGSLPKSVATEITRLKPARIVIVGGASVVSEAVVAQVDALTAGTVKRIAGADRYATAVAISKSRFASTAPVVYLASGETFPDALAGAPSAGAAKGPVLLTQHGRLPSVVEREIQRLRPAKIVVLGGAGAVGAAVVARLSDLTSAPVTRLAGADRYSTAVAISKARFTPNVPMLYLAIGENFPDALAAGPAAMVDGAPVLLTPGGSLPRAVADEIARLRPRLILVLGGPSVVSSDVRSDLARLAARF
ncbi:cell wall-binding repeat-containing protein [Agromyces humatus]|uniref:Alpha-amylase n=1 Tax=Agromyces humatus TaxID=279573 RepID=A0ABN2KK27_9MICO|nr:cell wall-binding repeat-containing protein [Agromyces humatus]